MNLLMNYLLHGWKWTGEAPRIVGLRGTVWVPIVHRHPSGMFVPIGLDGDPVEFDWRYAR